MKRWAIALCIVTAMGAASCGGDTESASPTAPTSGGGTASGGGSGSSGGCSKAPAPGSFAAAVSASRAVFTWNAVSGARDYEIMVGNSPGTHNMIFTNTSQTTYEWNGVAPGTYYARVEARTSCGNGLSTPELAFTVPSS